MAPKFQTAVRSLPGSYRRPSFPGSNQFRSAVAEHWNDALPKSVHLIGCRPEGFFGEWGPEWRVFGSDTNPEWLNAARLQNPSAELRQGSAFSASLFGRPFGLVISEGMERVENPVLAAKSIREQLVPGGLFIFQTQLSTARPREFWLEWTQRSFGLLNWKGVLRQVCTKTPLRRIAPSILILARKL